MRTLGDEPPRRTLTAAARARAEQAVLEAMASFEHVELRQHARDRAEERDAIALGLIDLGEAGA